MGRVRKAELFWGKLPLRSPPFDETLHCGALVITLSIRIAISGVPQVMTSDSTAQQHSKNSSCHSSGEMS
jgi:hypothetical protein